MTTEHDPTYAGRDPHRTVLLGVSPCGMPGSGVPIAVSGAGGLGVVDIGDGGRAAREAVLRAVSVSTGDTIGIRVTGECRLTCDAVLDVLGDNAARVWADRMSRTLGNVVDEMSAEENLAWLAETFGSHHARLAKAAGLIIQAISIVTDVPRGPLLTSDDLRALTVPVLSIVGSEGFQRDDPLALQAALPNCTTEVIEGQNHSVLVERHHTVRELVLGWMHQHESASHGLAGSQAVDVA